MGTIPARWDDRQRYSHAYGESDIHSDATDYFDTKAPPDASAAPDSLIPKPVTPYTRAKAGDQ